MDKGQGNSDEEAFGEYLDDKSITALGVLQTIGTLILTLESTPEVLLHLENVLVPVITVTLENKLFGNAFCPHSAMNISGDGKY